jgi:Spy/CpxP family protein refolding chaperone
MNTQQGGSVMRKLLISLALGAATVAAVPAAAQPGYGYGHGRPDWQHGGAHRGQVMALVNDLERAENRIDRSLRRGFISPREAFGLRREARSIRFQLQRASRDGIGRREFASLRFQVERLEQRIMLERRDWDRRRG